MGRLVARRLPSQADVEDVVQDVLLRVWKHGPALRDEERFGAWLAQIAYSAAADHLRARQRHPISGNAALDFEGSAGEEPLRDGPDAKEMIFNALRPFIAQLPPLYREAVTLSELDGLSHAAIAARLGLTVSGVKSRVQRGRAQLRRDLERCCRIALDARGTPVTCERRPDGVLPAGCCCDRKQDS